MFGSDWGGGAILGLQRPRVTGLALAYGPRAQRAGRALRALPVVRWFKDPPFVPELDMFAGAH